MRARASTATGALVDGTLLTVRDDLRNALLARPEQFVQTFTENLMTFALGRGVQYYDMPTVRSIVRDAGEAGLPALGDRAGHRARAIAFQMDEPRRRPRTANVRAGDAGPLNGSQRGASGE